LNLGNTLWLHQKIPTGGKGLSIVDKPSHNTRDTIANDYMGLAKEYPEYLTDPVRSNVLGLAQAIAIRYYMHDLML
jgi:hypothetical protein